MDRSALLRVQIQPVGFAELGQYDERPQRVEVIVERHLPAIHLRDQRSIGLNQFHAHLVRDHAPMEVFTIVLGDARRGNGQTCPIQMIVLLVGAHSPDFGLEEIRDSPGEPVKPPLNPRVLL